MSDRAFTVLVVSDNSADGELVQTALTGPRSTGLQLERVARLSDAIERLARWGIDAVLLDPFLPTAKVLIRLRPFFGRRH